MIEIISLQLLYLFKKIKIIQGTAVMMNHETVWISSLSSFIIISFFVYCSGIYERVWGSNSGFWVPGLMAILPKKWVIRPNLWFSGLKCSGKLALSTNGGSLNSIFRQNHYPQDYLGSITGSDKITRGFFRKSFTFSGSIPFSNSSSNIS